MNRYITLANFQEMGTLDCSIPKLNKVTSEGANSLARCFNTAGDTGPHLAHRLYCCPDWRPPLRRLIL